MAKDHGHKAKNESKTEVHIESHTEMSASSDQLEELENDLKRVQAEFINYKRRVDDERSQLVDLGRLDAINALLPVLDNIARALAHAPEDLKDNPWAIGVSQIAKQAEETLRGMGVTKIESLGQPFDPHLHEAIGGEGDIVVEELQPGYMMGDKVIRHAMVKVGDK